MSAPVAYSYVETPNGRRFTFVGAPPLPDGAYHYLLCDATGRPLLRVRREWVRGSTPEDFARRVAEDLRAHRQKPPPQ